jgi:rubrerythrin
MKPLETTVEEVLRHAIQSEVETRVYYQLLAERCTAPHARKRMLELADTELVHRAKMERKYKEMIGEAPPAPAPVSIELADDVENLDLARALKHALERERDSESYYRFMAERVPDTTELGRLFMELAEIEWKHKTDLQAEYDLSSPPDQFLMDI